MEDKEKWRVKVVEEFGRLKKNVIKRLKKIEKFNGAPTENRVSKSRGFTLRRKTQSTIL